jgi:hypothetical protein
LPNLRDDKKSGGIYLARTVLGSPRFSVRQTYLDDRNLLRHRELFDLGHDPRQFLLYPLDSYFHIRDDLLKVIAAQVEGDVPLLLEQILLPFIRKDLRDELEAAQARRQSLSRTPVSPAEQDAIARELHIFDRRRLHYLWYGAIDQSRLFRMPLKLSRRLLGKSRDEKEQYFIGLEQALRVDQIKEYLFTVFDLQRFFIKSAARLNPQGLNPEQLDSFFLDELCRLNGDTALWQGMAPVATLQPYLIRYLTLFFDYDFGASEALHDFIQQFMDSHRQFRFPERQNAMSHAEMSAIFGESPAQLTKLNRRELKNLFRKRAKQLHPDTGGDPEQFVRLKQAFEELLRRR